MSPQRRVFHLQLHRVLLAAARAGVLDGGHDGLAEAKVEWSRDVFAGDHRLTTLPILEYLHYVEPQTLARLSCHGAKGCSDGESCAGGENILLVGLERGSVLAGRPVVR